MPYSRMSFRMTLSDLEWLSEILNDTKHRAPSLRQLSFLWPKATLFPYNLGGRLSAPLWLCWCDVYSVTSVYSSFRSHTAAVASRDGSILASPASLGIAVVDSYDFKELRTVVIEFRFTWFVSFFSRRSFHMYEDHTYFIPCDSKSATLEVCGIGCTGSTVRLDYCNSSLFVLLCGSLILRVHIPYLHDVQHWNTAVELQYDMAWNCVSVLDYWHALHVKLNGDVFSQLMG